MSRPLLLCALTLTLLLSSCTPVASSPTPSEAALEPVARAEVGSFTWDFYRFEIPGGKVADLAIAEDGEKAYFVYLVSPPNEHDALNEQLFLRAVAAMASL